MKKSILFFVFLFTVSVNFAQESPIPNYRAAAKYSPGKLAKMVHSTSVNPHWLKSDGFRNCRFIAIICIRI